MQSCNLVHYKCAAISNLGYTEGLLTAAVSDTIQEFRHDICFYMGNNRPPSPRTVTP